MKNLLRAHMAETRSGVKDRWLRGTDLHSQGVFAVRRSDSSWKSARNGNQIRRGVDSRNRPGGNQLSFAIDNASADTTATNGRVKRKKIATNCRIWVSTSTIPTLQRQNVT